jgi:hypothetical protein
MDGQLDVISSCLSTTGLWMFIVPDCLDSQAQSRLLPHKKKKRGDGLSLGFTTTAV